MFQFHCQLQAVVNVFISYQVMLYVVIPVPSVYEYEGGECPAKVKGLRVQG